MMPTKILLGSTLLVLVGGCGPRLRPPAEAAVATAPEVEAPVANMTAQLDASKLDASRKYTQDGQFIVEGLFFEEGLSRAATVKVGVHEENGALTRAYELVVADLGGASAKLEMWDGGFLSVFLPASGAPPMFETSNADVKAATVKVPGGQPRTCYYGMQVLEGQIRFALCDLQSPTPAMVFLDVEAEAAASAPPSAPASAAPSP